MKAQKGKYVSYKMREEVHSLLENVIYLDIETTGLNPLENEIIEVGAIKITKNSIEIFNTLVKPENEVSREILNLCQGINIEDLNNAPIWDDVKYQLRDFLEDMPIICHNVEFEKSFFKIFLDRNIESKDSFLDSMELAMIVKPESFKFNLEYLLNDLYKIDKKEAHRGLEDCFDTIKVVDALLVDLIKNRKKSMKTIKKYLTDWKWTKYITEVKSKNKLKLEKVCFDAVDTCPASNIDKQDLTKYEELLKEGYIWEKECSTYKFREQQYEMSKLIKEALIQKEIAVIEAPTGIGKSVAYIVPSVIYSYMNKKKVFISTHTKALQSQLVEKDIPYVLKALNIENDVKIIEIKGKYNYICKERVKELEATLDLSKATLKQKMAIAFIRNLVAKGEYGDVEKINYKAKEQLGIDIFLDVIKLDEHFSCEKECKYQEKCYYKNQINHLSSSDVVVVNHSLLMSWPYETEGYEIKNVIIDEAHNISDTVRSANSIQVSSKKTLRTLSALIKTTNYRTDAHQANRKGLLNKVNSIKLEKYYEPVHRVNINLKRLIVRIEDDFKDTTSKYNNNRVCFMNKEMRFRNKDIIEEIAESIELICNYIDKDIEYIKNTQYNYYENLGKGLFSLIENSLKELKLIRDNLCSYMSADDYNYSCSANVNTEEGTIELEAQPIDVNEFFVDTFLCDLDSCVLTSATLSLNGNLDYFNATLGIDKISQTKILKNMILDSVYNYEKRTVIAIPTDVPKFLKEDGVMTNPEVAKYISNFVINVLEKIQGNLLILTTSTERLKLIKKYLYEQINNSNIEIIGDKSQLEKLKNTIDCKRYIIIGSKSFFEGLDIPGDELNCVILEKVPNLVPTNPMVRSCKNRNISYDEINKPQATIAIKQAYGRLLRSEFDYGYFFILNGINSKTADLITGIKKTGIKVGKTNTILSIINDDYDKWKEENINMVLQEFYNFNKVNPVAAEDDVCRIVNKLFEGKKIQCFLEIESKVTLLDKREINFVYQGTKIKNIEFENYIRYLL